MAGIEKYYKPEYVAEQLGVEVLTVYRWCEKGRLGGIKLHNRYWRISETDLQEFIEKMRNYKRSKTYERSV